MRTSITLRGEVSITYLRNGSVRIESAKPRPRLHIRGDEFMKLLSCVARTPVTVVPHPAEERFGAL